MGRGAGGPGPGPVGHRLEAGTPLLFSGRQVGVQQRAGFSDSLGETDKGWPPFRCSGLEGA